MVAGGGMKDKFTSRERACERKGAYSGCVNKQRNGGGGEWWQQSTKDGVRVRVQQ